MVDQSGSVEARFRAKEGRWNRRSHLDAISPELNEQVLDGVMLVLGYVTLSVVACLPDASACGGPPGRLPPLVSSPAGSRLVDDRCVRVSARDGEQGVVGGGRWEVLVRREHDLHRAM